MIEIEKPKIEDGGRKRGGTYGKFVVEPLERGYGQRSVTPCAEFCFLPCQVLR